MTSTSTSSRADANPSYRLPQRQPPLANKCQLHGHTPEQLCIIVTQAALAQIEAHSLSDTGREVGGALLGQAYRHGERLYVEVKAVLPAVSRDHGPLHFTFSADSWMALQQAQADQYPQLDMVGWFHTHPDLGAFYSSDDVVVHSAAFTLPWHVGLVLDPLRREGCFFGWQDGELTALPGFYELLDESSESVIEWRVIKTAVYHDMPPPVPPARSRQAAVVSHSWLAQYGPWPAVGGAAFLLLLFLFLGLWLASLNRQVDHLQQVVSSLATETLQETNVAACPDPGLRLLLPQANARIAPGPITFIGTAEHPEAHRYRLEGRLLGGSSWQLLREWRQSMLFGELGRWDTSGYPSGHYEVRLIAVDNNNVRLANSELCQIVIQLEP
jgi:proteasome lid subunit RPN8/RPN11